MVAKVRTVAFHGVEVIEVETQVTIASGLPAFTVVGLPDKAVAELRERVRAALASLGLGLPPQTDHRQPRPRRCAQGGQPFRPADRSRSDRGDGRAAGGRARRLHGARGGGARRLADERCRRAARGIGGGEPRQRRHLPGGMRRRGGLGGRGGGDRGAEPLGDRQSFQGDPAVAAARAAARAVALGRARPRRCEGPGERQARARNRRGGRTQFADGRPAGRRQVDAGGASARASCRRSNRPRRWNWA